LPALFRCRVLGFAQQGAIFRRALYERLGGFDESYRLCGDSDFFLRALRLPARLARLAGPSVACFRLHAGQLSQSKSSAMRAEQDALCQRAGTSSGWTHRGVLAAWRMANLPHYALRVLRATLSAGALRMPRTMDCPVPESHARAA
jgi:hypothetical protein